MTKLLTFLFFIPLLSLGQSINSTEVSGQRNIYNDAVRRYVEYLSKESNTNQDTLYVHSDQTPITDSLISNVRNTRLRVISGEEMNEILRSSREIQVLFISPLRFEEGKFHVSIMPFSAKRVNDENRLQTYGALKAFYSFNSDKKLFKFLNEKWIGI